MGYTTDFKGEFNLDRKLSPEHAAYLRAFRWQRHMKRNASVVVKVPDPLRLAVGLPVGSEGRYYVKEDFGRDPVGVIDQNTAPEGCPGLWCQWEPGIGDDTIVWDGGEKFRAYVEWLEFLITHFLKPWGYVLNGEVKYKGEVESDFGVISVVDNSVRKFEGGHGPYLPSAKPGSVVIPKLHEAENTVVKLNAADLIRNYIRAEVALETAKLNALAALKAFGDEHRNIEGIKLPAVIDVDGEKYVFQVGVDSAYDFIKLGSIV